MDAGRGIRRKRTRPPCRVLTPGRSKGEIAMGGALRDRKHAVEGNPRQLGVLRRHLDTVHDLPGEEVLE